MLKDLKYLLGYIAPLATFISIYFAGIWSFSAVVITFGFIPFLEYFTPQSTKNLTPEQEKSKLSDRFFDILLYLNIPMLWALMWFYFVTIQGGNLQTYEIIGLTLGMGISVGTIGINVAHELGHRSTWYEQLMSKSLLLSALYMHFFIEHNRGHHKNVATPEDPASASMGEMIYGFWFRSTYKSYLSAWQIENKRLNKLGISALHWRNQMIWFQAIQLTYLLLIGLTFGWTMIFFAIAIAIKGFLLLESVNYIEHYGLRRKKLENGRYEKVLPKHSWNSNHEVGRLLLYELTRHSDHHFKASRKYQVLRHFDNSPQLPMGYPGSILLALFPPMWFKIMNKKVKEFNGAN